MYIFKQTLLLIKFDSIKRTRYDDIIETERTFNVSTLLGVLFFCCKIKI